LRKDGLDVNDLVSRVDPACRKCTIALTYLAKELRSSLRRHGSIGYGVELITSQDSASKVAESRKEIAKPRPLGKQRDPKAERLHADGLGPLECARNRGKTPNMLPVRGGQWKSRRPKRRMLCRLSRTATRGP
jgi:hypothetical protein